LPSRKLSAIDHAGGSVEISYKYEYAKKEFVGDGQREKITVIDYIEMTSTGGYHYSFIDEKNITRMKMGVMHVADSAMFKEAFPDEIFSQQFMNDYNNNLVDADSSLIERVTIKKTSFDKNKPMTLNAVLQRDVLKYADKTPQIFLLSEVAISGFLRKLRGGDE
jgi:hypothetical protein